MSDKLSDAQVRSLAQSLLAQLNAQSAQLGQQSAQLSQQTRELAFRQTKIDALTHEIRVLRHFRFGAKTEGLDSAQSKLFEEAHAEDLSAAEHQLAALALPTSRPRTPSVPKRQSLPAHLPRVDIVHEPHDTTCACGQCLVRIGQDVSERLDYVPGHFQVERHIRGVWACKACAHMRQTAAPVQLIEGGLPTARLLAHVLVSKYDDHLPLYRQQELSGEALHAWCREKGLFAHQLRAWHEAFCEGVEPSAREERGVLRELQSKHDQLERQVRRKDKALAEAAALLVLQKKFQALWADEV